MLNYILSFGGGLNSTALLVYILKNKMPLDMVIFSDTGDEHDYTYESVKFYKKYAEDHGIRFDIVKSTNNMSLYEYCYNKKITPSRMTRNCTKNFKITPMRQNITKVYGKRSPTVLYIGIAYEEIHRMKDSDVKYIKNVFPLCDAKIDRDGCTKILEDEGLPIPKKSGCWYCPFKKKQEWIDMMKNEPEQYNKAMRLEMNNKYYPNRNSLLNHKPLIEMKKIHKPQMELTDFEPTCDVSGSCFL